MFGNEGRSLHESPPLLLNIDSIGTLWKAPKEGLTKTRKGHHRKTRRSLTPAQRCFGGGGLVEPEDLARAGGIATSGGAGPPAPGAWSAVGESQRQFPSQWGNLTAGRRV